MIIFTTAYSEYAVESYELNAIDYLLKPINKKRFVQAAEKARDYYAFNHNKEDLSEKNIYVRADFSLIQIALADILFVEGMADYLKIYIKDRKTVVARMTMKEIMDKLPSKDFIRINRSSIAPIHRIQAIRNKTVVFSDREVSIGNTYVDDFFKRFSEE
jgi:DNA-binding LytR/AlgR family response regulator